VGLAFITWFWGSKFPPADICKLADGVRRNFFSPYRFIVFTDRRYDLPEPIEQVPLEDVDLVGRGCFCRLRMFDLDDVITGPINEIFHNSEKFMILQGVNAVNPNPFNCSVTMLRAGNYPEVWQDFTLEKAEQVQFHEFPDDQGWIWHKLPNAKGWKVGETSGIYGFQKPGWIGPGHYLPRNARIVAFIGRRKPFMYDQLTWVKQHWRTGR
jgi:hypothetical protein